MIGKIRELTSAHDWEAAWHVLTVLRPDLDRIALLERRARLLEVGYQLIGWDSGEALISVAGFAVQPHVAFGSELWIHDLATLRTFQRQGYAARLVEWMKRYAAAQGCFRISVHSRLEREQAHNFYQRCGFQKTSLVFQRAP
jgi:GNAT superfamily N-acetyltransferase